MHPDLKSVLEYAEDCNQLELLFLWLAMWSVHILDGWRCRLNLFMFLLAISAGRVWSVHSVLGFSATKKNLRIMSDIERVLWTVILRMASRVFLFFTPSDWNWFVWREPRTPVAKFV